jgi:ribosomal subunit interface protein
MGMSFSFHSPMHIEHFEKGIRYSDRELLLLARKLGKMATYCSRLKDEASVIRVEAERRPTKKAQDEVKVMITVELPRKVLRAESRKGTVVEAVDRCVEKLEPQLLKYKEVHMGPRRPKSPRSTR